MARKFSGPLLQEKRIAAGLKPEAVALHVGRSFWSIAEYERGRVLPSVPILAALSEILGCSIDSLFVTEVLADA